MFVPAPDGAFGCATGTSSLPPRAMSGVAALLIAHKSSLTPEDIRALLGEDRQHLAPGTNPQCAARASSIRSRRSKPRFRKRTRCAAPCPTEQCARRAAGRPATRAARRRTGSPAGRSQRLPRFARWQQAARRGWLLRARLCRRRRRSWTRRRRPRSSIGGSPGSTCAAPIRSPPRPAILRACRSTRWPASRTG